MLAMYVFPSEKSNLVHFTSPRKEELGERHGDYVRCHQGLTSLTKEELDIFSCLESLKRRQKRKLQKSLFVGSLTDPKR